MGWPSSSAPAGCEFLTCHAGFAIRGYFAFYQLRTEGPAIKEDDREETWLCPEHSFMVKDAQKRNGLIVCRTVEGWIWVDNLKWVLFG